MNYEKFKPGYNKPTIITGEQYGIKVSVELDHSDTELDELMDAFETIAIGLGYHKDSLKNWILERASEYQEEENDKWDLNDEFENVRHQYESREELEDEFFGRYRATEEDEDEFSFDGGFDGKPHFEWGDEPEEDTEDLFEGEEWEANEALKSANERYKSEVKKMNTKQKRNSK
jgi:hypothetical protein